MKRYICLVIYFAFSTCLSAQKVKYKKGKISVDKKDAFIFDKEKQGGLFGTKVLTLSSVQNNQDVLVVTDTALFLKPLPFEASARLHGWVHKVEAPELGKKTMIPLMEALNFRKKITKELESIGFFKTNVMTEELFGEFVSKNNEEKIGKMLSYLDSLNEIRLDNYNRTAELFGELPKRSTGDVSVKDGVIKEKLADIGKFKREKKGSYATVYQIININKDVIGKFVHIPSESRANVQLLVNEIDEEKKLHWLNFKVKGTFSKTQSMTLDEKMAIAANYLVTNGYM